MADQVGGNSGAQLRALVERIERLEGEKKDLGTDITEVYAEAKGTGFDPAVMRILIRRRKQDASQRAEQEAVLDLYENALK